MPPKADILIVTVTKIESRAVLHAFEKEIGNKATPKSIRDRMYFDLGILNGAQVFLTQSEMGSGGLDASLLTVRKGIDALSPAAVIMVGIAFGVNEQKQAIGDILVTENLRPYDLQRVGTQGDQPLIILRSDKPHASPWLINHFKSADVQWEGAKIRFGVVLTGEKLVDNADFRDQLISFEPEAIGGEMEGAGLYVACQDAKVDWILVKAICDWADGNKGQDKFERQQTAAQNAAEFVVFALQFAQVDWDKKRQEATQDALTLSNSGGGAIATDDSVAAGSGGGAVRGNLLGGMHFYNGPVTQMMPAYAKTDTGIHSSLPYQPYFFGREKELQVIADAISPEARTWGALIDGPGGIGKTALAIRAGHLAPISDFPCKIFLSAKVRELTPEGEQKLEDFMLPNYQALLVELARELGDEYLAQTNPNERANAVRRALVDKNALIIIDNVETFSEAERNRLYQFLSRLPTTCKVIVTSRRRDDLDARAIRLDRMAQNEALDLLDELAKNNRPLHRATPQERVALYEITNGNPLLIRWVVGQLGRQESQCRTISEACEYLKNARKDNNPLEYIFGDLLDTFTPSETAVLAALTYYTQPAKVEWIAAIASLPNQVAQTALEDLADRALLVADAGGEIFYLPSLAAEYLRRKRPEIINQTGDRLANRAYALAMENGYENFERFPVLEAEWPTLDAGLPRLVQGANDRLQEVCYALRQFLDFSVRWDERMSLNRQAEEKALVAQDLEMAGWRALEVGYGFIRRDQVNEALECAERCVGYWEKVSSVGANEKSSILNLRGWAHISAKNYLIAIDTFREALNLQRAFALENEEITIILCNLAIAEQLQGDITSAESDYRAALQIAEKVNYREGIVKITSTLADLALDSKELEKAALLAYTALELSEKIGWQMLIGCNCQIIAQALARQGKPAEGLPYARRAIEIFSKLPQTGGLEDVQATLLECGG